MGTVDRFWFDVDVNFWTVKFIGDVQCTLDFVDARTQQSIYKSKYAGSYTEEKAGGLEKTWTVVMNRAIDKLIEDIVLDEALASALAGHAAVGTACRDALIVADATGRPAQRAGVAPRSHVRSSRIEPNRDAPTAASAVA